MFLSVTRPYEILVYLILEHINTTIIIYAYNFVYVNATIFYVCLRFLLYLVVITAFDLFRGFAKKQKFQKSEITREVGGSRCHSEFF